MPVPVTAISNAARMPTAMGVNTTGGIGALAGHGSPKPSAAAGAVAPETAAIETIMRAERPNLFQRSAEQVAGVADKGLLGEMMVPAGLGALGWLASWLPGKAGAASQSFIASSARGYGRAMGETTLGDLGMFRANALREKATAVGDYYGRKGLSASEPVRAITEKASQSAAKATTGVLGKLSAYVPQRLKNMSVSTSLWGTAIAAGSASQAIGAASNTFQRNASLRDLQSDLTTAGVANDSELLKEARHENNRGTAIELGSTAISLAGNGLLLRNISKLGSMAMLPMMALQFLPMVATGALSIFAPERNLLDTHRRIKLLETKGLQVPSPLYAELIVAASKDANVAKGGVQNPLVAAMAEEYATLRMPVAEILKEVAQVEPFNARASRLQEAMKVQEQAANVAEAATSAPAQAQPQAATMQAPVAANSNHVQHEHTQTHHAHTHGHEAHAAHQSAAKPTNRLQVGASHGTEAQGKIQGAAHRGVA